MVRFFNSLHRNEHGSISIASVFSFIFLTMVLGMVINIGRHADRKVKIQNAADAVTYTGSGVVARSMNTLAFTNHLLCDVFAVTAYLREARDRNAEELCLPILDAWDKIAPKFQLAPLEKFSALAGGIPRKTQAEAQFISVFSAQNSAISEQLLPVVEEILQYEMIPEFQRALVAATPDLANQAANEIASRHGPRNRGLNRDNQMAALMWRTDGMPFGSATFDGLAQMPVSDPVYDSTEYQAKYFRDAVNQRRSYAQRYLSSLNYQMLKNVDGGICSWGENGIAKMSQFGNLWRGFTRGYLNQLLVDEYPDRNLLFQIRYANYFGSDTGALEKDFMFVGVAYWKQMQERMPGLFSNPLDADSLGFAQAQLFVPKLRIMEDLQAVEDPDKIYRTGELMYPFRYSGGATARTLMTQNWSVKLVPATAPAIPTILQTDPPNLDFVAPNLGGISVEDFQRINTH